MKKRKKWTPEQREQLVGQARTMTRAGHSLKDACSQLGIDPTRVHRWERAMASKPRRRAKVEPTLVTIPVDDGESRFVLVMGSMRDLSSALRALPGWGA